MYRSRIVSRDGQTYNNPTITGVANFADGTAALPSIASASLASTGISFASLGGEYGMALGAAGGVKMFVRGAANRVALNTSTVFSWGTGSAVSGSDDTYLGRGGINAVLFAGSGTVGAGAVTSRVVGNKAVSAIANAVATDVLTVTIPNAAHSASLKVKVNGSLGAGGAIGANEASATNTYDIIITRTAGVATVVAISSAYGAAASAVAGAATVTATATVTAMTGAVGAQQTFTVQVTISRSGGSSSNHTCFVYYELINSNATGVTVA